MTNREQSLTSFSLPTDDRGVVTTRFATANRLMETYKITAPVLMQEIKEGHLPVFLRVKLPQIEFDNFVFARSDAEAWYEGFLLRQLKTAVSEIPFLSRKSALKSNKAPKKKAKR